MIDPAFSKEIQGKKVILVGPGKYLLDKEMGGFIDSHDVVIRTNRGCELIEKNAKHLGRRTDVLYSCLIEQKENAGPWDKKSLVDDFKIKHLCTTPNMDMKGIATATILHHMVDKQKYLEVSNSIPCRIIDHVFFTKIAIEINCRPTTGYIAIHDILRHDPKKLSIVGFDFYYSGWIDDYKEGMTKMSVKEVLEKTLNSKRHVHKNMWRHCKSLLSDKRFSPDDQLLEVLSMKDWWFDKIK